jgi:hypothetical protein
MHDTREGWLNFIAGELGSLFAAAGVALPERIRIAIGFPSTGDRGHRLGECWDKTASRDHTFEILIRPDVDDPQAACAILAHELVHAAVGIAAGHGPRFRRAALAIGLVGPMRSTRPGPAFLAAAGPILAAPGPLPHARLSWAGSPEIDILTTRPKRQTTRLAKCACRECGYIVRTARFWIARQGPPHCPQHGAMRPL